MEEQTQVRPPRKRARRSDDPLAPSFTFLRVRGISIGVHWSLLIVVALLTWSLSAQLFPIITPDLSETVYLAMGVVSVILFFLSILLHELGHALVALRENMTVGGITLWAFGGVARFRGMFPSAGAEFRIAIAGPVVSLILVGVFAALAVAARPLGAPEAVRAVLDYLARINAIVVAFNMVPALPLDGGRVLRSWLWHRQRSFSAATISASKAGTAFGYLLVAIGVLGFFTDVVIGGIWFVLIGWFLLQAAQSEAAFVLVRQAFHDLAVRDLMTPNPEFVSPGTPVEEFLEEVVRTRGHSAYPVAENGQLLGLVSIRLAGSVPQPERATTPIQQIMLRRDDTPVLAPGTPMMEALEVLRSGPGRAVVVDDGQIVGILSASDVAKALEIERARGIVEEPAARRAPAIVWVVVVAAILLAGSAFYRPPLAVFAPADAIDISGDITISGVPSQKPNGKFLLVAVQVEQPTGLGVLWAIVHPDRDVVPISSFLPEGIPEQEFTRQQRGLFDESQLLAAAAAAQAAGLQVTVSGTGVRVLGTVPRSPAADQLRDGDVITAVNGSPVRIAEDLRRAVSSEPPGTPFVLRVEREGGEVEVEIRSARLPTPDRSPAIGVLIETRDIDVDLPFEIQFRDRNVGGPSAGLAYALAIADMLDPEDIARDRTIAASGTIQLDGEVGLVGGLSQKAEAAEDADADLMLVPLEEIGELQDADLPVRGVDNLADALSLLTRA